MRKALTLALILALATPAASFASISIFGAYLDSEDLGEASGLGARLGFKLVPGLKLELAATLYEDFDRKLTLADRPFLPELEASVEAMPIDLGLRLDLGRPGGFYLGGGGSYFLLDSDLATLDDELGYYGLLGLQLGRRLFVEAVWRQVDGTVEGVTFSFDDPGLPDVVITEDTDVDLGGFELRVGFKF